MILFFHQLNFQQLQAILGVINDIREDKFYLLSPGKENSD